MTDARFPERWLNDRRFARLDDRAYRAFSYALMWSVSNRSDGVLIREDLELVPYLTAEIAGTLVGASLFETVENGWRIREFEFTQTTAENLAGADRARVHEREKKRRQRAHKAGDHSSCPADCLALSPGTSPGKPQDRTGQARLGALRGTSNNGWDDVVIAEVPA